MSGGERQYCTKVKFSVGWAVTVKVRPSQEAQEAGVPPIPASVSMYLTVRRLLGRKGTGTHS